MLRPATASARWALRHLSRFAVARKTSRLRGRERGTSTVELAFVLPVFLLLLLGALDFGQAIVLYNAASGAARDGARAAQVVITPGHATVTSAQSQITAADTQIKDAALRVTSPLAGLGRQVIGSSRGMDIVTTVSQDAASNLWVTTTVTTSYQPIAGQFLRMTNIRIGATSKLAAACGHCL